jgi:FMN phosphatase YigB (HAD superfamily)
LGEFKIVSLDMFQTLVDVNSIRYETWKRILKENYTVELADRCWIEANKLVFDYFNNYDKGEQVFLNVKTVFENCYKKLFTEFEIKADPKVSAHILANQHTFAIPYQETEKFINSATNAYKTCLVSDADTDMILPIIERYIFDKVFISEEYMSYKNEATGKIFKKVLQHYNVLPQEIIHIGDGYSDIAGASKVGITTCWLNRDNKKWEHIIKPDYIITSLLELAPILNIDFQEIV